MRLARDKVFERLRKLEMGKNTHKVYEISKRHLSAIKVSFVPFHYECILCL